MSHERGAAGTGELVLATLWLAATPEREAALRRAAEARVDWNAALGALEAHGVLGLALRNLEQARAEVPGEALRHLRQRAEVMRAIELGARLTLERFAAGAARAGVELTLLKGASLALDLYPEGGLRTAADVDVLVEPREVLAALGAAHAIGLRPPCRALPVWWYRLAHFHLKLASVDPLQREVELHWRLEPESQLLTARPEALRARRRPVDLGGTRAWTLDPLDRLVHLVTHLARHFPGRRMDREALLAVACDERHALRLKWLLDVHSEVERRHAERPAGALAARAVEWSSEAELERVLSWLRATIGFAGPSSAWVDDLLARLPAAGWQREGAPTGDRERRHATLHLRASALLAFPRWVWPPAEYHRRLRGSSAPTVRISHAARAVGRGALAGLALPIAWLARAPERRGWRSEPRAELAPEQALELAAAARRMALDEERGRTTPKG